MGKMVAVSAIENELKDNYTSRPVSVVVIVVWQ